MSMVVLLRNFENFQTSLMENSLQPFRNDLE